MAEGTIKQQRRGKSAAQTAIRRFYVHLALLLLIFVVIAVGAYWYFSGNTSLNLTQTALVAKESEAKTGLDHLQGRWVRPDGGYVLEIKEIGADGKMKVGYFNPFPINVSQAEATDDGKNLKVFIELRDVNYPGATYHLTYDRQNDQLKGIYMQPALRQSFQVIFLREKQIK